MSEDHNLRVATFNVWFGDHELKRRAEALCDLLDTESPDVIALQEFTPAFGSMLRHQPWTRQYQWSTSSEALYDYSNLLLCRLPNATFERTKLWSYQGRHLDLVYLDSGIAIGTVHLESRRHNAEIRGTQLSDIFSNFGQSLALLMGDFNFDDGSDEEAFRPDSFRDAWTQLHSPESGPTFDTSSNLMARSQSSSEKQVRYDRVWAKSSELHVRTIRRIGLDPIPGHNSLWPSDHFGLVADLNYSTTRVSF